MKPLATDPQARQAWPQRQLVQISESMTGRAIRTPDWTYCIADMTGNTKEAAAASYNDYQLYDQRADPSELINLAGRQEYETQATRLRGQLVELLRDAGELEPEIIPAKLYL